jgi:Uma2 family endonuclease
MDTVEKKILHTYEEYLQLEIDSDFKSEFYDGEIYSMSGGTRNHNLIATNVAGEIRNALRGKSCSVFTSDLKLRIEAANANVYPDGMVICGTEEYYMGRADIVMNPILVIEVLSDSTGNWDRGGNRDNHRGRQYELLPELQEYVLIEQNEAQVDVFRRNAEGFWVLERYAGEEMVVFKSLDAQVSMKEIYHRVEFGKSD